MLPFRSLIVAIAAAGLLACGLPETAADTCSPWWSNPFSVGGPDTLVRTLAVWDEDGAGAGQAHLYVGGAFELIGGVDSPRIAKWTGSTWNTLSSAELSSAVFDTIVFDDDGPEGPHNPALFICGNFQYAGVTRVDRITKWDGVFYQTLGSGLSGVAYTLEVWDDDGDEGPNLPALYVGGLFTHSGATQLNYLGKWDGTSWSAVGGGMSSFVNALGVYDDDGAGGPNLPKLYAGGGFNDAGGLIVSHIGAWNGTTWERLQMGIQYGVNDVVNAMTTFDDGSGEKLYVGGFFTTAAGQPANRVASWDGSNWAALGSGLNASASALIPFDHDGDNTDPAKLYVAGAFTQAGGNAASKIASWDGSDWAPLGSGLDADGQCLAVFDPDGSGGDPPALIIGGDFTSAGGLSVQRLAQWSCPTGGSPPSIIEHPTDVTVCASKSASFTVKATGPGTLSYQWRHNANIIGGATADILDIDPVELADAGDYDCVVTNSGGSVISNPATLTVYSCGSGDMNCDGITDLFDINPFVLAATNPNAWQQQYPGCNILNGDCNKDTVFDLFDINAFVDLLAHP